MARKKGTRYDDLLSGIFDDYYRAGITTFEFRREEIEDMATRLGIILPKNLGDLIYSFRYRTALPGKIARTAPAGYEWIIAGAGKSLYRFKLVRVNRIVPSSTREVVKIPDATPQLVLRYATSDEQAVLAKVRYNRLIDIFLRITAYSLQNHLRTTVKSIGQIETDELYVGVRNTGQQFVVPVQAKGGKDQISVVQIQQDLSLCAVKFPELTVRAVAVQHMPADEGDILVMFELVERDDQIQVVDEKHYRLVPAQDISIEELHAIADRGD